MTKDAVQRRRWTFYEAVRFGRGSERDLDTKSYEVSVYNKIGDQPILLGIDTKRIKRGLGQGDKKDSITAYPCTLRNPYGIKLLILMWTQVEGIGRIPEKIGHAEKQEGTVIRCIHLPVSF